VRKRPLLLAALALPIVIAAAASALVASLAAETSSAGSATIEERDAVDVSLSLAPKSPASDRLEPGLRRLIDVAAAFGAPGVRAAAQQAGIELNGDELVVIIEAEPGRGSAVSGLAEARGAAVEGVWRDLVQARVAVDELAALAQSEGVAFVRLPLRWVATDRITGKGVGLIGADEWHAAGFRGAGVKVAVLDIGFDSHTSLLGTELPDAVTTHSCRADGDITGGGEPHGTAVAEVVHEVAPAAELYLVNFNTDVELGMCVDWLKRQGVHVINFSVGFIGSGPGDGSGPINEIAAGAVEQGIVWVNGAGNQGLAHWLGPWMDGDGDDFLNFIGLDETNHIDARDGERIDVLLKWDDPFGASCNDYDLYLIDPSVSFIVAASEGPQDFCSSGVPSDPVEFFSYEVVETGRYHIAVARFFADGEGTFHLYTLTHDCPILEHCVPEQSIVEPADHADVLAAGAVAWNEPDTVEPFSSRGPTADGRVKPDLVAPDGVSNLTFGAFYGTSSSAAHTSGAAALVRQWQPKWTGEEVRSFLRSRAIDLGDPGKDNTFGAGRLDLGMPKPTPTPTATSTPTPTPTPDVPEGDANCDRVVNSVDVALVLQRGARLLASLPCEQAADLTGDGVVDARDAALILQLVARLV
jgi:subtilisin family serine protease